MTMASATRRRICAWVVTRLARPGSPPVRTPLTMLASSALTRPTTTQVTARMTLMNRAWVAYWAQSGVATATTASCAPR